MADLGGRRAVVTGASGGIGSAIARALVAHGATVVVSGTRRSALEELAAELGEGAVVAPANLGEEHGAEELLRSAESALGGIDILIHNAGVTRDGLLLRLSEEDWRAVLDLNLTAGFRLAQGCLRGMMKRRWGRIIGITSIVGTTGNAGQANYAASKAGMIGMMKSLAQEVANRGITVNCVAPGFIETEMTASLPAARKDAVLHAIPAGRYGQPADVAPCVAFLCSDSASYITGETIHINGGMAMH